MSTGRQSQEWAGEEGREDIHEPCPTFFFLPFPATPNSTSTHLAILEGKNINHTSNTVQHQLGRLINIRFPSSFSDLIVKSEDMWTWATSILLASVSHLPPTCLRLPHFPDQVPDVSMKTGSRL